MIFRVFLCLLFFEVVIQFAHVIVRRAGRRVEIPFVRRFGIRLYLRRQTDRLLRARLAFRKTARFFDPLRLGGFFRLLALGFRKIFFVI